MPFKSRGIFSDVGSCDLRSLDSRKALHGESVSELRLYVLYFDVNRTGSLNKLLAGTLSNSVNGEPGVDLLL